MELLRGLNLEQRQVTVGICCGMNDKQISKAIDRPLPEVRMIRLELFSLCRFSGRVEFAVNVNAAVRDAYKRAWAQ